MLESSLNCSSHRQHRGTSQPINQKDQLQSSQQPPLSLSQIQTQLLQSLLSRSSSTGILQISNMKINSKQWQRVFSYLHQEITRSKRSAEKDSLITSLLNSLCLINNRKPTIIKTIEFISFPHLTKLSLDGNKIESIQALEFMHLPSLKQLFLYRNSIKSFKPLQKCLFKQLYLLSVYDNFGIGVEQMNRMGHQVSRMWIEGEYFKVQGQDIAQMVKFEAKTNKMSELGIKSKDRIRQIKVYDKLKQKHNHKLKIMYDVYRDEPQREGIEQ